MRYHVMFCIKDPWLPYFIYFFFNFFVVSQILTYKRETYLKTAKLSQSPFSLMYVYICGLWFWVLLKPQTVYLTPPIHLHTYMDIYAWTQKKQQTLYYITQSVTILYGDISCWWHLGGISLLTNLVGRIRRFEIIDHLDHYWFNSGVI